MRKQLLVTLLFVTLIIGCKFENQSLVKSVVNAFNSGNPAAVEKNLSDNFVLEQDKEQLAAGMFIQLMDSLHGSGFQVTNSVTEVSDTLICSVLTVSTKEDVSLGVEPLRKYQVKWHFSKKKLTKIEAEGDKANNEAYKKAYKKARAPFEQWVEEKADKSGLLEEYSSLTPEQKEAVAIKAALTGTFICSKCYFEKLIFKNATEVTVYDAILGIPVNSTFKIKGRLVTIKKEKKEFIFELVDWETLIGKTKGATGEFKKIREL